MKKNKDIEKLLLKYMDGNTSIEEERHLVQYFCSNDIPDEWKSYKVMFDYFNNGMPDALPTKDRHLKMKYVTYSAVLLAACAILTVLMTWNGNDADVFRPDMKQKISVLSEGKDSISTVQDSAEFIYQKKGSVKHKRFHHIYKDNLLPPKEFLASTDSVHEKANEIVDAKLCKMNILQERLMQYVDICNDQQAYDVDQMIAELENNADDEIDDENYK